MTTTITETPEIINMIDNLEVSTISTEGDNPGVTFTGTFDSRNVWGTILTNGTVKLTIDLDKFRMKVSADDTGVFSLRLTEAAMWNYSTDIEWNQSTADIDVYGEFITRVSAVNQEFTEKSIIDVSQWFRDAQQVMGTATGIARKLIAA